MNPLIPGQGGDTEQGQCHRRRHSTSCILVHMHKGEALPKFFVLELGNLKAGPFPRCASGVSHGSGAVPRHLQWLTPKNQQTKTTPNKIFKNFKNQTKTKKPTHHQLYPGRLGAKYTTMVTPWEILFSHLLDTHFATMAWVKIEKESQHQNSSLLLHEFVFT